MAQKKKFKTTEPLQADPWLAWCSPVYKSEAQDWLLDFPEVRQEFERAPTEYLESMRESCVAKYLLEAADEISDKSREILPEVPDVKAHPIPAFEYLRIYTGEVSYYTGDQVVVLLPQLLEDNPFHCNLFRNLLMLAVAWPHKQAVNQLKELAPNVIRFLMAAHRFLQKKIALANTMGLKRTVKKLENADKSLCMIELTGDMDKDAKQLFLVKRITPDDFRIAMRSAFKLDREATVEINNGEQTAPLPQSANENAELLKTIDAKTDKLLSNQESHSTKLDAVDSKSNEIQAAANRAAANSKGAKAAAEQAAQSMVGLPAAIAEVKSEVTDAKVAAEDARAEAAKAAKRPTTVVNAQPGSTVNVVKPPRTDKGGTHTPTPRGWRQQADMVKDFSRYAKKIRGKIYGKMTLEKVKDWEKRYPDETRREPKSGYHAKLRNTPNPSAEIKNDYWASAANWNDYWRRHNNAFTTWLKDNPNGDHALFRKTWERPGKIVHMSDTDKTMRYGTNTFNIDSLDDDDIDA